MSQLIADGPEDLTASFLSHTLGREVRSVTVDRIGTGQTGAAFRVTFDTDDGPTTLVAKTAAGDAEARGRVSLGYRAEVGFYRDVVSTVDVRTPKCWYAALSDDACSFTLLLDDLAPRNAGVQADGCSVEQAADAVVNLAALHAPRWNDDSLFDLPYLSRRTVEGSDFLGSVVVSATEVFVERFRDELDPIDVATLRQAAEAMARWAMQRPEPFSVTHGDYRLDNLMFHPDHADVMVVDWQTFAVAPPAHDLAYFLGTSLSIEDRRASERELVSAYHSALVDRGVTGHDVEGCFDDYRFGHLQGPMITTLGCAYATRVGTPASDEMFLAMARRSCAAIRDLGTLDGW